jgi:hypothetical protein
MREWHKWRVIVNGKGVLTVLAKDIEGARQAAVTALSRPGRYAILSMWERQGSTIQKGGS